MSANNSEFGPGERWWALYLVVAAMIFFVAHKQLSLMTYADDVYFSRALDGRTIWDFLQFRYYSWSGRVILEWIMVGTINFSLFWKLGIPASFLLLAYGIWRLSLSQNLPLVPGNLVVISLLLLISGSVAHNGGWWVTGFYNYLLPVSLGVFVLSVVVDERATPWYVKILCTLATIISCQQEQAALALIFGLSFIVFFRGKLRVSEFPFLLLIIALMSAAVLFLAPGNYNRLLVEIRWFPEFAQMNLFDKLILGLDRVSSHLNDFNNKITLVAAALMLCLIFLDDRPWLLKSFAAIVLCVFIVNMLLGWSFGLERRALLGTSEFAGPENWYSKRIYLSYALSILFYGALLCASIFISRTWIETLRFVGTLVLGVVSSIVVSFSPTIYASGPRVLYMSDVIMVIFVCLLLSKLISEYLGRSLTARCEA